MANIISLRACHTKHRKFKHRLLTNVSSYTNEEIALLAEATKKDPNCKQDFILAMRLCLKGVVGRYLYYWPETLSFIDDMVSEGFTVLVEAANDIPDGDVAKVVTRRIEERIKTYLNDNQSLCAPSLRQQWYLVEKGDDPIYMRSVGDGDSYPEDLHPEDGGDEATRDILDAFSKIQPEDEIDIFLMEQSNWGRGYQELADELGVGVATVHRRKSRLYQKYLDLTR